MYYSHRRPAASRRRVVSRGSRRKTIWVTDAIAPRTVTAGQLDNKQDLLAQIEVAGMSWLGATIVRTHATVSVSHTTSDTNPGVTYGFVVTDLNDSPDPSTDFGDRWLQLSFCPPSKSPGAFIDGSNVLATHVEDIRAQRRLEAISDRYFLMLVNRGSNTLSWSALVRTLIKLP